MWIRTAVLSLTATAMTLTGAGISAAPADLGPPTRTPTVTAGPSATGPARLTGVRGGLGLADRVGFRVFTLTNPYRVVVDVAHQPSQPFGTATVSRTGTAPDALVERVRSGAHPGYDRLVFDIIGPDPVTFQVRYLSGSTIQVGFSGMGSPTRSPHASHSGPATVPIGLTALKSVSFTIIGAGLMDAAVSTAARHGFRVSTLTNPTRIALDIAL